VLQLDFHLLLDHQNRRWQEPGQAQFRPFLDRECRIPVMGWIA
jgi:hypothetical protein